MDKENKISREDLEAVKTSRVNVNRVTIEAEKAVAVKKIAELELENLILKLYHKYNLTPGMDTIKEDGTIIPKEEVKEENNEQK